jgi:hypothetical protein
VAVEAGAALDALCDEPDFIGEELKSKSPAPLWTIRGVDAG